MPRRLVEVFGIQIRVKGPLPVAQYSLEGSLVWENTSTLLSLFAAHGILLCRGTKESCREA
ncbi:MAG: hypothetical protein ACFCU9_02050 [Cyanophyceae cyanobacterium]